ncbi:MAG: hypothetical protein ACOCWK_01355 [Tangfeifania sp.]
MNQVVLKYVKYFVFSALLLWIPASCDQTQNTPIPYVPVSFTIDLSITNELTIPGNSVYFPGVGYGGIIISCLLPDQYYAFDAACTYNISQNCLVLKNEEIDRCPCLLDNLILTCSCCESEFSKIDGSIYNGPASAPLKQYNVSMVNDFTLRVYN